MIPIPTNLKLITTKNVPTTTNLEKGEIAFGKIGTEDEIRLFANPDNEVKEITPIKQHNNLSGRNEQDSHPISYNPTSLPHFDKLGNEVGIMNRKSMLY